MIVTRGLFFLSLILFISAQRRRKVQDCECGPNRENDMVNTRIINGKQVEVTNKYPWMAYIQGSGNCGGAIINDRFILTAAHCLRFENDPRKYRVYIGSDSLPDSSSDPVFVKRIIRHPEYKGYFQNYDIGLLELEEPIEFSENVQSICLPSYDGGSKGYDNLVIAGWGVMRIQGSYKESARILREAEPNLVDPITCQKYFLKATINPKQVMCAGGKVSSCMGDSGGPLMWMDRTGRYFVVGITSFGQQDCSIKTKAPTVYERTSVHLKWILENTKSANWCPASGAVSGQDSL